MSEEKRADVVFVIDASDSMKPCFDRLRNSIKRFVEPFREEGFTSLRLGLLAYNAGPDNGKWVYRNTFINGDDPENMSVLYGDDEDAKDALFTRSGDGFVDIDTFCDRLDSIQCCADENTPLALDCAADFPFEPLCTTRRVIVLFTDERLEDGVLKNEALGANCDILARVMDKIDARHITLYYFGPSCQGVDEIIGETPRTFVTGVTAYQDRVEGQDVWGVIDFDRILASIGGNISRSALQIVSDPEYERAVFGQNEWSLEAWGRKTGGGVVDITNVEEGAALDMSETLQWINAKLRWMTAVDLDIHAFYLLSNGEERHVYFSNPRDEFMGLDRDAGIGDKLDDPINGNEENIRCSTLNGVERILIATKIFNEYGCFSDYRGSVEVSTSNSRQDVIRVRMESRRRLDWCVIAMIDNSNSSQPRVYAINRVVAEEPKVYDTQWQNVGR